MKNKENNLEKKTDTFWEDTKEWAKIMLIPLGFGVFTGICGLVDYGLNEIFPNYTSHNEKLEIIQRERDCLAPKRLDKNKNYVIDSTEFIYRK